MTLFGYLAILLFSTPYARMTCSDVNLSFITFSWFTKQKVIFFRWSVLYQTYNADNSQQILLLLVWWHLFTIYNLSTLHGRLKSSYRGVPFYWGGPSDDAAKSNKAIVSEFLSSTLLH